jgi:hypothetical protein
MYLLEIKMFVDSLLLTLLDAKPLGKVELVARRLSYGHVRM